MTVLDPGMVDGRVSARTRAILLVTPPNPTGVIFSRQSLEGLGKIAARHGLLVLDDPYSPFVYGDNPGRSDPASIRSFDGRLAPHLFKIHDATLICVPQLFDCVSPQGAYYVFPKITGPQTDSRAFSIGLLEEIGVAVTPGVAFGPSGEGHVRMAYCVDEQTINGAFDRIEDFLSRAARPG